MEVVGSLARDPQVIVYFAVLGWSMVYCFRKCSHIIWPLVCSLATLSVTWFYIMRYTYEYKIAGGNNLFDDAYVDVVKPPHYAMSAQLLTWVIVASVWARNADIRYILYGMLGAMSGAYVTWIPVLLEEKQQRKASNSEKLVSRANRIRRDEKETTVPLTYALSSAVSFLAVLALPRVLGNELAFGVWLKLLHIFLVLPRILCLTSWHKRTVHPFPVYVLLGLATAVTHWMDPYMQQVAWPETDCQLSISCDCVLCAALTLYYIYKMTQSVVFVSVMSVATLLFSPGAVLALYLASEHWSSFHGICVTRLQIYGASMMKKSLKDTKSNTWVNLGLWLPETSSYSAACEQLAKKLGSSALDAGDRVLCCGCGFGSEVTYFKNEFKLQHITGIDAYEPAIRAFKPSHNIRLQNVAVEDMANRFPSCLFNKVLALDNVYHYASKKEFFSSSFEVLKVGGTVGVTDIILEPGAPTWVRCILTAMNIPWANQWTTQEYNSHLKDVGYTRIKVEPITNAEVLEKWFPSFVCRHVRYAVVTACVSPKIAPSPRKKVAVIGSGLSGLVTASELVDTHDVTIYEANEKIGLSGQGLDIHGSTIDIPLRMIGQGYYNLVEELTVKLDVPTVVARADCTFYGDNGPRGISIFSYALSRVQNLLQVFPHVWAGIQFAAKIGKVDKAERRESWGEWLDRNGYGSLEDGIVPWLLMGQNSWLLSCTYDQVRGYPARILLEFIRGLNLSLNAFITLDPDAPNIVRVSPSMKALETALIYGCEVHVGTPVMQFSSDLVINGIKYDSVVIATEARAVQKVYKDAPDVFGQVEYHPSSIYVHTDPTLMPANEADWKALNVRQSKEHNMCQLTVWMNEYYPEYNLPHNIFQTWNAHTKPKGIIKEANFYRVVHTKETEPIQKEIELIQGKNNVFYAGSYTSHGMGLLEQAARSGVTAAVRVKGAF